jgi:predicted alpha/beta superfamily hydrolase
MKKIIIITTVLLSLLQLKIALAAGNVDDVARYESLTLPNTEVRYLDSTNTHESYRIYVSIPAEYYIHPNKKYPAIFLLDADYSFPIVTAITNHLSDRNRIPPMFIFGIAYAGAPAYELHRTQDYTPTYVADGGYGAQYQKLSGGAPKFAAFLQSELIPYLNQSFRLNDQRTLVGHSFGGLFGSWSMLNNPALFSSYIIVSPSLWYDNNYMFKLEKTYAKSHKQLPVNVFFGIGSKENGGDFKMVDSLNNYVKMLQQQNYKNFKSKYMILPNDDHDMIFPDAFTQGIMYLYEQN